MKYPSTADIEFMARTVYGEASAEPKLGQIAVAWVIRNRAIAKHQGYDTIAGVCLSPYQFSCWNSSRSHARNRVRLAGATLDNSDSYRQCYARALGVLCGDYPDPTHGAKFYFADYIPTPKWARGHEPVVKIGRHIFFNTI